MHVPVIPVPAGIFLPLYIQCKYTRVREKKYVGYTNDCLSFPFAPCRSAETDSHGQEYVILGADIRTIEDPKRSFTFSLMCKGVPEMYFSSEDEDSLMEWFSKLAAASNAPDNSK